MDNHVINYKIKKVICFFGSFLFLYCATKTKNFQKSNEDNLSNDQRNVVNTLLRTELSNKRYKYHLNDSVIIIKEAMTEKHSIEVYESFLRDYKNSFLDSIQMANLKKVLKKEPLYYWKKIDFDNKKIGLQTREDLEKSIRNEEYLYLPDRLIFHLSKPFFINKNQVLMYFMAGSFKFGSLINSSLVLIEKDANGKWIIKYLGSNSS